MKFFLKKNDGGQVEDLTFDQPRVRIGRKKDNDVILKGPFISKFHAEVLESDGEFKLLDLSKNGTFLNDERIFHEKPLKHKDSFKVGGCTFLFVDARVEGEEHESLSNIQTELTQTEAKGSTLPNLMSRFTGERTRAVTPSPEEEDDGGTITQLAIGENTRVVSPSPEDDDGGTMTQLAIGENTRVVTPSPEEADDGSAATEALGEEEPRAGTEETATERQREEEEEDEGSGTAEFSEGTDKETVDHKGRKYWIDDASFVSFLSKGGLIDEKMHRKLLKESAEVGQKIDEIAVGKKILDREKLMEMYKDLKLEVLREKKGVMRRANSENMEPWLAEQYGVIPLEKNSNGLSVLTRNPLDLRAMADLSQSTGVSISTVVADCQDEKIWNKWIKKAYEQKNGEAERSRRKRPRAGALAPGANLGGIPADQLVDHILDRAISERASDIHIEPSESGLVVRLRTDGVLNVLLDIPLTNSRTIAREVTAQLKVRSKCNVAEKRLPQDSRFTDGDIDFRVSTLPIIYGEKTVLRILEKDALTDLDELGMSYGDLELLKRKIKAPNGLILISGPTGSGKTTTLYSALSYLPSHSKNIVTVEDPVEYRLPGVHQMHVRESIGLTFATGLRSILRQDPDVIMVGEIRDRETAEMAIQASLTGHVVFSTLHTNSAVGIVNRLVDMGVEPFLVASSVSLAVAQRLVRVICDNCKKRISTVELLNRLAEEAITEHMLKSNGIELREDIDYMIGAGKMKIASREKDCTKCKGTGYYERRAVYEMLDITPEIRGIIVKEDFNEQMIHDVVEDAGMSTLLESGLEMVESGVTSIEELFRVIGED